MSINVSLSIYHRLLSIIADRKWVVTQSDVTATRVGTSLSYTIGSAADPPVMCVDAAGYSWRQGVVVKLAGVPLDRNSFTFDYRRRLLTFASTPPTGFTVDVVRSMLNVVEGYPDEKSLQAASLPIVAFTLDATQGRPFDIGSSYIWETDFIAVDILARNDIQLKTLAYTMTRMLSVMPLRRYNELPVLDPVSGDINPVFDPVAQFVAMGRQPRKPSLQYLPPRPGGSDKERHRALISLEIEKVA